MFSRNIRSTAMRCTAISLQRGDNASHSSLEVTVIEHNRFYNRPCSMRLQGNHTTLIDHPRHRRSTHFQASFSQNAWSKKARSGQCNLLKKYAPDGCSRGDKMPSGAGVTI